MFIRQSPGECPICGAEHTTCAAGSKGPITSVMLPARDEVAMALPALVSERIQETLPPGQTTTATYRGKKGRRP
jgi:hypothetical protein